MGIWRLAKRDAIQRGGQEGRRNRSLISKVLRASDLHRKEKVSECQSFDSLAVTR